MVFTLDYLHSQCGCSYEYDYLLIYEILGRLLLSYRVAVLLIVLNSRGKSNFNFYRSTLCDDTKTFAFRLPNEIMSDPPRKAIYGVIGICITVLVFGSIL